MFWLKWGLGLSVAAGVYGLITFYNDPDGWPTALIALCAAVVFAYAIISKRRKEKERRAHDMRVQTPRRVFTPTEPPSGKSDVK